MARVGGIGAHVRYRGQAVVVVGIVRADGITLRRIQVVATVAVVIRRLIPLVLAGDRPYLGQRARAVGEIARDRVVRDAISRQQINTRFRAATALPIGHPVREARRVPEAHIVHRLVREAAHHAVSVAPFASAAGDASTGAELHARVVERMRVRRRLRVQERRILSVRHLVGADVVIVADSAVAGGIVGVARVTDKDGVDSDCRSSGSGQQASREERVLDRYH